ncbi:hypothetical protein Bealeia1_00731 [Candidatus Bealeia paramacronuclearis]|uniref:Uncharacterized protein n=1 Tax=Candidatus Bealeia paramacronuclearis TaxID=1921001 RepID=A0ABZ2C278_9PROT|nr:hypothetical protein [Candidatus Bealeia paramacronuclearis]
MMSTPLLNKGFVRVGKDAFSPDSPRSSTKKGNEAFNSPDVKEGSKEKENSFNSSNLPSPLYKKMGGSFTPLGKAKKQK